MFSKHILALLLVIFSVQNGHMCGTPPFDPAVGLNIGNLAPEISLPDPDGKIIQLSSLRGKMVLIDFWASWCMPCRHDNPSVVAAYEQFKDKKFKKGDGFTIYSVSLDANANAWRAAISKDQLSWNTHVSDLRGWDNAAALQYHIESIPRNMLINGEGVIVAIDLHGQELVKTLKKLAL